MNKGVTTEETGLQEAMEDDDLLDVSLEDENEEPDEEAEASDDEEKLSREEKKRRRGENREREWREEQERKEREWQQQLQAERDARIRAEAQASLARAQPPPQQSSKYEAMERDLQPLWDRQERLASEAQQLQRAGQLTPSERTRLNRAMLEIQDQEQQIRIQYATPRQPPQPTAAQQMAVDEFSDVVGDPNRRRVAFAEEARLYNLAVAQGKLREGQAVPLSISRQALENVRREFGSGPAVPPPDADRRKTHGTGGASQAGAKASRSVKLNADERSIARERFKGLPENQAYREFAKLKLRTLNKQQNKG